MKRILIPFLFAALTASAERENLCRRGHCFQAKAAPGTGSYTWLGRIWEFMNHKRFNK